MLKQKLLWTIRFRCQSAANFARMPNWTVRITELAFLDQSLVIYLGTLLFVVVTKSEAEDESNFPAAVTGRSDKNLLRDMPTILGRIL